MEDMRNQAAQTVADMMRAREARAAMQRTLLLRYPGTSVVCLCMNIAGPVKTDEAIERAFAWGAQAVRDVLAPHEVCPVVAAVFRLQLNDAQEVVKKTRRLCGEGGAGRCGRWCSQTESVCSLRRVLLAGQGACWFGADKAQHGRSLWHRGG